MKHSLQQKDLKKYVCNMQQIAGIKTSVLDDGVSKGIRVAEINNGSGLIFKVLIDRGMDIGEAGCCGVPFAWLAPGSPSNPAYYDNKDIAWLRAWGAGLFTGCGTQNVGCPSELQNGEQGGLHGRLSNIPAENFTAKSSWIDGKYTMVISGEMREARLFSENILTTREITTVMGENSITVKDTVKNEGCRPAPLMLLYHINIGYPLLDSTAVLEVAEHSLVSRDAHAEKDIASWNTTLEPDADFAEQCYYHDMPVDSDGLSRITVANKKLGMGIEVAYRKKELPFFTQWKMMGQGEYVMGLEPANCHPEGQNNEKEKFNSLRILEPEESFETFVKISVKNL